ncbi:MAG: hypothetical protein HOM01_02765 [Kordiimonadaceae bacterium]|jgi:hypothetical protein|nr:hypothetical protein [Kordiimonadaceae bacterium]
MMLFTQGAKADVNLDDVKTIDAIIGAMYSSISGSKDQQRDWQRFLNLFDEDARLIFGSKESASGFTSRTPEQYVEIAKVSFAANNFYESEISRKTHRFGNIAQVFTTYAGKRSPSDEMPFLRGINSVQLAFNGERWFIVTIFWQAENDMIKLPEKFLD